VSSLCAISFLCVMDSKLWNILCWNVRGLNDPNKWDLIYNKIDESACSLFCFQETKKEFFDLPTIRKFAPKCFDAFEYVPSNGASGGITIRNTWLFNVFSMTIVRMLLYHPFCDIIF